MASVHPSTDIFGTSRLGVLAATQFIVLSALSAGDQSASEVPSVKTLIEVLGASLKVCIPLVRTTFQHLYGDHATEQDKEAFLNLLKDGIIQNLNNLGHFFFQQDNPVGTSPSSSESISPGSDGGDWPGEPYIVPAVLQSHHLNLDILSKLGSSALPDGTAQCCAEALQTSLSILVKQAQVYLQGGLVQLKLALATIRAVLDQPPESPVPPERTSDLRAVFGGASQLALAVILYGGPLSHLPEERECGFSGHQMT